MKTDRLFEIIHILLNRGTVTAPELARHFEVSTRTIYRDIDVLSGAGVPVYCKQGAGGGVTLMPGYTLPQALVSKEERDSILMSLKTLQTTQFPQVEQLLEKLGALFQTVATDWIELDFSSWNDGPEERDKLSHIQNALLRSQELEFDYLDAQGRRTHRCIQPIKLLYKQHAWYLVGWCLLRKDVRLFRLSRMRQATPTGRAFDRAAILARVEKGAPLQPDRPLIHLTLRFGPQALSRLYDDYDDRMIVANNDGTYTVQVAFPMDEWVYGHLMSFGPDVEVLHPAWIRQEVAKRLKRALDRYEG